MNTKVKIGIAAVIVSALVALIVLDQKTAPKTDGTGAAPPPAADESVSLTGDNAPPAGDARRLLDDVRGRFAPTPQPPTQIKQPEPSDKGKVISPPPAPASEEYVIKKGDTYATIAKEKLGDAGLAGYVAKHNPSVPPDKLRVGGKISIPPRPDRKSETAPVADGSSTVNPAPVPSDPAPEIPKIYVVQSGDTLSGISKKFYNTTRHTQKIFEANKDQMESAHDLRAGMKLNMPEGIARNANANPAAQVPTAAPAADAAAASGAKKTHQVAGSESLWKIAEKYAGDRGIMETIEAIIKANPDKLADSKTLLRVGWTLIIPE